MTMSIFALSYSKISHHIHTGRQTSNDKSSNRAMLNLESIYIFIIFSNLIFNHLFYFLSDLLLIALAKQYSFKILYLVIILTILSARGNIIGYSKSIIFLR